MSIWGKILGGAAGFLVGGPLGALLGVTLGHYMADKKAAPQDDDATARVTFTIGVVVLAAKMAKADGRVTRDEIQAFRSRFHVAEGEAANVARVFNMAKEDPAGFEIYARQIAHMLRGRPAVLEELLDSLFLIAMADGTLHPAEEAFLREVASIFGFDAQTFARIRASHAAPGTGDPYAVLGVAATATDAEIKAAHRKLVKEHHPDRLMAQGMPQEFIDVATDKLAAINAAYDRICRERGIR
jgi:DnaJ like chaperone protein